MPSVFFHSIPCLHFIPSHPCSKIHTSKIKKSAKPLCLSAEVVPVLHTAIALFLTLHFPLCSTRRRLALFQSFLLPQASQLPINLQLFAVLPCSTRQRSRLFYLFIYPISVFLELLHQGFLLNPKVLFHLNY